MSKYIKLQVALERLNELYHGYEVEEWLKHIPTIDIVHCKDCIRFDGEDCCERIGMILYPEDIERHFCGYGERKEE